MKEGNALNEPQPIEQNGQRVLTTEQLAELYGTTVGVVQMNFKRNSNKFIEGKHFFKLEGEQLRAFKNEPTNCGFVGKRQVKNIDLLMRTK